MFLQLRLLQLALVLAALNELSAAQRDSSGGKKPPEYQISLENFKVSLPGLPGKLGLACNFTLIKRSQFPYLTVDLHMASFPLASMFTYHSTMRQTRIDRNPSPDAYKSHIDIESRSSVIQALNFNLSQDFENEDFDTGFESMSMVIASKLHLNVDGRWSAESLRKKVNLAESADPDAVLLNAEWDSETNPEYLSVVMKLRRNLIQHMKKVINDEKSPEDISKMFRQNDSKLSSGKSHYENDTAHFEL